MSISFIDLWPASPSSGPSGHLLPDGEKNELHSSFPHHALYSSPRRGEGGSAQPRRVRVLLGSAKASQSPRATIPSCACRRCQANRSRFFRAALPAKVCPHGRHPGFPARSQILSGPAGHRRGPLRHRRSGHQVQEPHRCAAGRAGAGHGGGGRGDPLQMLVGGGRLVQGQSAGRRGARPRGQFGQCQCLYRQSRARKASS